MSKTPDLDAAYGLKTPEDSRKLYADWAESYDSSFAANMDYQLPLRVAEAYAQAGGAGPVLDIGAGTGLAGQALAALGVGPVDGTDISGEMLVVAGGKGVYRDLFEGDMTARLPVDDGAYAGIVSSGTFTTGHVGPEALDEVLRIMASGALAAISVSAAHFDSAGFAEKFDTISAQLTDFWLVDVRIYGPQATGPHKDDMGRIALFRKA